MTISATIDQQLSGNDFLARLTVQVGNLGAVASKVAGLIEHPPQGIGDLLSSLKTLPLPDIQIGGDLRATLGSLSSAIPADLSPVTSGLTDGLTKLEDTVGGDLAKALDVGLRPILDLAKLTQVDFTCGARAPAAPAPGSPAAPPGAGSPAAPPGAGSPAAPPGAGSLAAPPGAGSTPAPASTAASALDQAIAALGTLPSPLTVDVLLPRLLHATTIPDHETFIYFSIPFLDDFRDALETLLAWKSMQPATILANLVQSLEDLDSFVKAGADGAFGSLAADLGVLAGEVAATTLGAIADGIVTRLGQLASAVGSGDISSTGPAVTALNALLDQYNGQRNALQGALGRLPRLADRLDGLPARLDDALSRLVAVLQDPGGLPLPADGVLPPLDPAVPDEVGRLLSPVVAWVEDLVAKLDLSAIQGPITTVANSATAAVDGLDAALAGVTTQVQHLFAQVGSLLDALNLKALTDDVQSAIDGFRAQLVNQLNQLFAPARTAIEQAIAVISQGVQAFDPQDLLDGLKNVMGTLTGVLKDPAVLKPLNDIKGALDTATQQIRTLSFAPVTDEVLDEIDQITRALQGIDSSKLSPALQLALQGALALLPDDLTFATGPIEADFDQLVDKGPGALVAAVRAPVGQLLAQVKHYEPAALIGDALSEPFNQLVDKMQAFAPSGLLGPVNQELEALKSRLRESAGPGRLLEPLQAPFDQLRADFDRIEPDAVVKPLQEALDAAIDKALKAIPVEDLLTPVGAALAKVQEAVELGNKIVALVDKVHALLQDLADGATQLDAWLSSIMTPISQLADTSPVQATLGQIRGSLDSTKAAALGDRFEAAVAPAVSALDALGPQAHLTAIVQAYREISPQALQALPGSPQKAALVQVLDRANPLQPAFGAPFESLTAFRQHITSVRGALSADLAGWDARYHAPDGVLACLTGLQATGSSLAAWIQDTATSRIVRPVKALLAIVGPVAALIEPVLSQLRALMTAVTAKLTGLLTGPGSVTAIKDAVDQLVARIRHLDLGFLSDSLRDLFHQMRAKLEAVNPAALAGIVDKAFDDMLATLDMSQIIPAADVKKLDDDYAAVVAKLKKLDPKNLVAAVQPVFEATVLPLIRAFDLSAVLDALIAMLQRLKGDLKTQLDRVNQAYRAMLAAAPSLNPLSISVDVSAAVGSLF